VLQRLIIPEAFLHETRPPIPLKRLTVIFEIQNIFVYSPTKSGRIERGCMLLPFSFRLPSFRCPFFHGSFGTVTYTPSLPFYRLHQIYSGLNLCSIALSLATNPADAIYQSSSSSISQSTNHFSLWKHGRLPCMKSHILLPLPLTKHGFGRRTAVLTLMSRHVSTSAIRIHGICVGGKGFLFNGCNAPRVWFRQKFMTSEHFYSITKDLSSKHQASLHFPHTSLRPPYFLLPFQLFFQWSLSLWSVYNQKWLFFLFSPSKYIFPCHPHCPATISDLISGA
jgi:hypothetical protein